MRVFSSVIMFVFAAAFLPASPAYGQEHTVKLVISPHQPRNENELDDVKAIFEAFMVYLTASLRGSGLKIEPGDGPADLYIHGEFKEIGDQVNLYWRKTTERIDLFTQLDCVKTLDCTPEPVDSFNFSEIKSLSATVAKKITSELLGARSQKVFFISCFLPGDNSEVANNLHKVMATMLVEELQAHWKTDSRYSAIGMLPTDVAQFCTVGEIKPIPDDRKEGASHEIEGYIFKYGPDGARIDPVVVVRGRSEPIYIGDMTVRYNENDPQALFVELAKFIDESIQ